MASQELLRALKVCRSYTELHTQSMTETELMTIPEGLGNNILWNMGHLIFAHDRMLYGRCGLESSCAPEYAGWFAKGSDPKAWTDTPPIAEVVDLFHAQMKQIITDYAADRFQPYEPLELVPGFSLNNAEDAIGFIIIHESVHHGNINTIRKLLNT